jgi:hypothetical protein
MTNGTGDAGEVRPFRLVSDPAGPPYDHRLPRPKRARVLFREIPHCLDRQACRQALIRRQVAGQLVSMESLAEAAGCSRSTASRFFAGRVNNLKTTLLILEQLGLHFDEVATQCGPDDDCAGGPAGQ